jgi:catechol 2,3-dioxygenase-like lactoylglutathione lyase family enzyme
MAKLPLHHLDLNVSDLERSRVFYDKLLTQLGYRRVNYSTPDEAEGYDWLAADQVGRFSIGLYLARQGTAHDCNAPGVHDIAFAAPSRVAVDDLHHVLTAMGPNILDPPRDYLKIRTRLLRRLLSRPGRNQARICLHIRPIRFALQRDPIRPDC